MRIERDSMGEVQVPEDAVYGASTQRAADNFPISALRFGRRFIWALGLVKAAAAETNRAIGVIEADKADAIVAAAEEVMDGRYDEQFVVDIFQTGSGTSTNMNANEIIANRATELLGGDRGSKLVHPNDDVNASQSSNDVIPTAIHVAAVAAIVAFTAYGAAPAVAETPSYGPGPPGAPAEGEADEREARMAAAARGPLPILLELHSASAPKSVSPSKSLSIPSLHWGSSESSPSHVQSPSTPKSMSPSKSLSTPSAQGRTISRIWSR